MGQAEFYENYAKAGFAQLNSEKVNALALRYLKSPVLDVGCYFGKKTSFLAQHFEKAEGCDISKTAVQKAGENNKGISFFECDFEKKGLQLEKKYNSIFAVEVIEHLFDTQQFLQNCKNALNKHGMLFITTPNAVNLSNRLRFLFGNDVFLSGDRAHIRFFNPKTIRKEIEKAGFKVVLLEGYNGRKSTKKIPMPLRFCEGIVVVAEKQ